MVKVVATARGYFGGEIREAGSSFDWPDKTKLGSWVKRLGVAEAEQVEAPADDPGKLKGKGGRKKAEQVEAATAEPFADAPAPVRVKNEVAELTGSTQPDWVAPQPVTD